MGKVVICEDEPSIRKLVRVALRNSEHEVRIAVDGVEGLALVEQDPPDLVVTDVSMPRMDGFALADAIRARPALNKIRILFMTASVQPAEIEECYRHGANAVLTKPFTTRALRDHVDTLVSGAPNADTDTDTED